MKSPVKISGLSIPVYAPSSTCPSSEWTYDASWCRCLRIYDYLPWDRPAVRTWDKVDTLCGLHHEGGRIASVKTAEQWSVLQDMRKVSSRVRVYCPTITIAIISSRVFHESLNSENLPKGQGVLFLLLFCVDSSGMTPLTLLHEEGLQKNLEPTLGNFSCSFDQGKTRIRSVKGHGILFD